MRTACKPKQVTARVWWYSIVCLDKNASTYWGSTPIFTKDDMYQSVVQKHNKVAKLVLNSAKHLETSDHAGVRNSKKNNVLTNAYIVSPHAYAFERKYTLSTIHVHPRIDKVMNSVMFLHRHKSHQSCCRKLHQFHTYQSK